MKMFVIVGGTPIFINDLLQVWKEKYQVKVFSKHRSTLNIGFLKRKFRAAMNILDLRKGEILANYDWSEITFVEWASYALRIISERVDGSTPIITRLHRYEVFSPILNKIDFSVVSKIVLVSDVMRRELEKRIPKLKEKVVVIPHGIQTENWPFSSKKLRTRKICIIGHLIQSKRIDLIMKAIKSADDISLHIAGSGRLLKNLRKLARELKIDERTSFYGQIPHQEIPNWLIDKDIIVSSSDYESFHICLIEGMASGVIPLIRNWPGADEIYPSEFILPFRDQEFVDSLKKKIIEFYNLNESKVEKKREQVRTIVKEKFSFNKQVEKYDQLFSKIQFD